MLSRQPASTVASAFLANTGLLNENERLVLRLIRQEHTMTRPELIPRTGLTQQSVHRLVDGLMDKGFVEIVGFTKGYRGQPAQILRVVANAAYSFGLSIGVERSRLCLLNLGGSVVERVTLESAPSSRADTLAALKAAIPDLLAARRVDRARLAGIGVALPASFVGEQRYLNPAAPLMEWGYFDVGQEMADVLQMPVWIENSATAAAIGEALGEVGRSAPSFIYLQFSYGFGGGVILDGAAYRGTYGNAGEFSAAFEDAENRTRPALQHLLEELEADGRAGITVESMLDRFDVDWPGVGRWLGRVQPQVDRIVNTLRGAFDLDVFVIGGDLPVSLGEILVSRIRTYGTYQAGVTIAPPRLVIGALGPSADMVGAANLPLVSTLLG